jgi:hypothetical protein
MADATVVGAPPMAGDLKPGYKTTEFWTTLVAGIVPYFLTAVPPQYSAIASAALAGVYTIGRSVVKYKQAEGKWSSVQLPSDAPAQ